jgi:RNA 2',3'-cyclic 3'-phosphodiesterase
MKAAAPALGAAAGRPLAQADWHVTLCFLGAVGEAQQAALCVRAGEIQAAAFELRFDALALWRGARILAASGARVPPAGLELVQALAAAAREVGLAPDLKAWRPHLTLVRSVTAQRSPAAVALELRPALPLPATRFYLAESQGLGEQVCGASEGRRYATLASWPLRA